MVRKEFRELSRDRRTVAMIVAMPILLLVVFGYAADFGVDNVSTAVLGPQAQQLQSQIPDPFTTVETDPGGGKTAAKDLLVRDVADVAVVTGTQPVSVLVDGSALF